MTITSLFSSDNQTQTTNYCLFNRWSPMCNRARTISRPWLDLFCSLDKSLPAASPGASRVAMETVVIVAIGVLATVFLASFVALVVVCRHRYCHPHDLLHHFDSKSVKLYKTEDFSHYENCIFCNSSNKVQTHLHTFISCAVYSLFSCCDPFYSVSVVLQTHSGSDWCYGDPEWALRTRAGWCGHH